MHFVRFLGVVLVMASLGSCQSGVSSNEGEVADFGAFYQRFLSDSLYQLAHITFPLEGLPPHASEEELAGGFRWEKSDWVMHRVIDQERTGFRSELINLENDLIVERIVHRRDPFVIERRFAKMGQEWYLIYYAALNEVAQ